MRRVIFFFFLLGTIAPLYGKILETAEFKELLNHVEPQTLVVLDIDDTLLTPTQTLGTHTWFLSRLKHHLETKKDDTAALDRALAEWSAVRHLTDVKLVETNTEEIVSQLQADGIAVMGLTGQEITLSKSTVLQLRTLGIDLSKTPPIKKDVYFTYEGHGVLFRDGILFTSRSNKGAVITKFLEIINYQPKHILFIDNEEHQLHALEKQVKYKKIRFTGLRYSASDERSQNYSQEIADIQWRHSTFNRILSDEEARFFQKSYIELDNSHKSDKID
jgi:hydroxymethylpyrimidine pyrophosphatase-like HAD family hydrolase